MSIIHTETLEYPLSEAVVRARYPNVSFATADFPPAPYSAVQPTDRPACNRSAEQVVEASPVLSNGEWVQAWAVVALAADIAAARLAEHQAQMWENIKAERDRRKIEGGYTAAGKWFHSDVFSRTQQIGLVMLGANIPANLQWKTMSGDFVTMTQTLAAQIFQAAAAQDVATFQAAETHRAAMEASADPGTYSFSGGWPAVFAG